VVQLTGRWLPVIHQRCIRARPGLLRDIEQDVSSEDAPKGLESSMKHHAFSPRAAAAAAGMAVLLVGGTATGAMAAVTSASAPSARQGTPTAPGAPTGLTAAPGNGTATPQGSGSVTGSGSRPGSPTGLKTSSGDGFIALSWSPPTSAGSSPVTGYLGHNSSFAGARQFTTSDPSFRLTDAENGSLYYIKVTALNAAGEGPATPVTSVVPVPHAVPTRPVAPSGLTARVSHRSVILSWSQPGGGTTVSDYLVYVGTRPVRSFMRSFDEVSDPRVHTYTMTGLPTGARYYFRVLAVGATSVSLPSNETSVFLGAGTGTSAGSSTISVTSSGVVTGSGAGHGQPGAAPRSGTELAQDSASSGLPTRLIVLLVALAVAAAAGGAMALILRRRRRHDRQYRSVPAPRRPYDDQPTGQFSRTEEMNGPRHR
jgi:hypothetical protein